MKKLLSVPLLFIIPLIYGQYLPVHPTNQVYSFLSELANDNVIDFTTVARPYSYRQISEILNGVDNSVLNSRQKKELIFYQRNFRQGKEGLEGNRDGLFRWSPGQRFDLFNYFDSPVHLTINPIGGGDYFIKSGESAYHWWNGAGMNLTIGNWALYGSLRDNHESERLTQPAYMNQNYGGANFKSFSGGKIDYWELRGGISYDFGIGNVGVYKDHFTWGNNYNGSNILSGRTHSFAHIAFNIEPVEWFSFRYIHGWLVSEVVDSAASFYVNNSYGTDYREVYHRKYIAANLFTFKPLKDLHLSFGNSIIYDFDTPHLVFFIPFMFYKAVDHHLNSGIDNMNSQMFFDLSARLIPKTHIYGTLFIDELAIDRLFDPDEFNFISSKAGIRVDNLVENSFFGFEYTYTNALTYRHYVNTTTFESNRFNLGHYLQDNARELHLYVGYRPFRAAKITLSYTSIIKGPDHTVLGTESRTTIKPLEPVVWESDIISLQMSWNLLNDIYLRAGYTINNSGGEEIYKSRYSPLYWRGKVNGFNFGLNFGF